MNQKILNTFSRSSRQALESVASEPESAAELHNRLADLRVAMKVALEVIEKNISMRRAVNDLASVQSLAFAGQINLSVTTSLEMFMNVLEQLHPQVLKKRKVTGTQPSAPLDQSQQAEQCQTCITLGEPCSDHAPKDDRGSPDTPRFNGKLDLG